MRSSLTWRAALAALACWLAPSTARADTCLDAGERARVALAERRLLAARSELRACAAPECDEAIRALCDDRLREVNERLPSVVFHLKEPSGADISTATLSVDGTPLDVAIGAEIVLDPGPHHFTIDAGGAREERTLVLLEREKGRRETVVIGAPRPVARAVDTRPPSSAWRTAGFLVLGAGAVGLGIGTAFGIDAIVKERSAGCDASNVCDDPSYRRDARAAARVSTIALAAGAGLAIAGGLLVFLSPRFAVGATVSGATFAGRW
ncbi:MAG: hypothetical protein KIT84_22345 [Labilithrix sp.]|nr:hypothetical protein [Labilithrix sp.]MCW5813786.1 hypothetical protein [Labilithrix sp.]